MKKLSFLVLAFTLFLAGNNAFAQGDADYVTDENLRRYAIIEDVKATMVSEIRDVTSSMVKNQDGIDGARFNELSKGAEPANDFEKKFMDQINEIVNDRKKAIGDVIQTLATKMMPDGGKAYQAVKKAISSDAEVKAKYEKISSQIELKEEA